VILSVLWVAGVAVLSGPAVYLEFQRAAAEENARARQAATIARFAKYEATVEKDGAGRLTIKNIHGNRYLVQVGNEFFRHSPEGQAGRG
jgi:hypothetical protein